MSKPKTGVMTHTRYSRVYELREGRTVAITSIEPSADCWYIAKQKAEQLQVLSMMLESAWSELSTLDDSLALALFRLASDMAGDIAGLVELAGMAELEGDSHA